MKSVNLNDQVWFKLLPIGEETLETQRQRMREYAPHLDWSAAWRTESSGYHKMQLWEVAQFFGTVFLMGINQVMENTLFLEDPGKNSTFVP